MNKIEKFSAIFMCSILCGCMQQPVNNYGCPSGNCNGNAQGCAGSNCNASPFVTLKTPVYERCCGTRLGVVVDRYDPNHFYYNPASLYR